jgi:arsenite-transporting ATPase
LLRRERVLRMSTLYDPAAIALTKYVFFTGKGGVGKTSAACATAVKLADSGKRVLLISTDPASNLQDVLQTKLSGSAAQVPGASGLYAVNLDPIEEARKYRESVVAPYRGKLPDAAIANMEEQLSGSCTVEIAAFNAFSAYITDQQAQAEYDHILFDTAPTGHTLRMLQLPSAWTGFISENTHGASCLGQLSGLEEMKDVYKKAVDTLADGDLTTLVLVARPEETPLKEAARAAAELEGLGVCNRLLIVNGVLETHDDAVSESLHQKQREALRGMPDALKGIKAYEIPMRAYNVAGLDNVRAFLSSGQSAGIADTAPRLADVVNDLYARGLKVIFTMGKGGVGKTTVAAAVALGLAGKGKKVHLATTDPAAHLRLVLGETANVTMSHIDEAEELRKYSGEVLEKARATLSEDDVAYIEEDLRSPCTQEIAVFRAFAEIVARAGEEVVVIDTAPTGHTLLLLDATLSYHREVQRTHGDIPASVQALLPRLRDPAQTEVVIVTLAETTPYYEALRLEEDLARAGLTVGWWVVNASFCGSGTVNRTLRAKAASEMEWINRVDAHTDGRFAVIGWSADEMKDEKLLELTR